MIPSALTDRLASARHVCVLTGAGISAESGLPTFRDERRGLWAKFDPLELATPDAFAADPALVWRWYAWRRECAAAAAPNPAHVALAALEALLARVTLVTQNVDGLHQRAGSSRVIEFHGNIFVDRCFREGRVLDSVGGGEPPACPVCGGPVRPGVVWFGESIPGEALEASCAAAADCDVFLSIGTSANVYPAAGLVDMAREGGASLVEVNPEPAAAGFEFVLAGRAGELLPKLVDSLQTRIDAGGTGKT